MSLRHERCGEAARQQSFLRNAVTIYR